MDSVCMAILILSSISGAFPRLSSVSTKILLTFHSQGETRFPTPSYATDPAVTMEQQKEPVDSAPLPDVPPTSRLIEVEETQTVDNRVLPPPPDTPHNDTLLIIDGNSADEHQITTHEHVDQAIGHVPPTKRVKKILPPFEGKLSFDRTTASPQEVEGIRLVPSDSEDGEGATMQKTIWDLLRERSGFSAEPNQLPETTGNDTETTTSRTKTPYEHFDADSAEMEVEMSKVGSNIEKHEMAISNAMPWLQVEESHPQREMPQDVSRLLELSERDEGVRVIGEEQQRGYGGRPSKWYLLLLLGNSTIVELRREDFSKYLKLNLAARLSVEYDDVKVNKVILAPPKVLVNVSVFAPSDDVAEESQLDFKLTDKGEVLLHRLAETNATLLELSGEEYRVIRFLPFESHKPEAEAHKDVPTAISLPSAQNDLQFIAYTLLGSACACAALLILFLTLNNYKRVSDLACFNPNPMAWRVHHESHQDKDELNGVSPAVIYSGGFPQIRGSWMTGMGRQGDTPPPRHIRPQSRPRTPAYSHGEDCPCASPRHSKLQMYNCDAKSVVIPIAVQRRGEGRGKGRGGDSCPLEMGLPCEERGEDNPMFTN